ncbi:MAG TPA: hypothetical protein VNN79_13850 [Actinomycetota bacterium]|nr:hypothetical protein [Actinomycetota bacterium]
MRFRYSQWDDTQDPFGPDVAAGDLLDAMSEELLSGDGAEFAMRRLLRRGIRGRFNGLDSLRARLRRQRREEQDRLNLAGPLEEVHRRLEEILERERTTLSFDPSDDARMRESFLDALPPDAPGKIGELRDYRFTDQQAQREFDELMEFLKNEVLNSYFKTMTQGMQNMSPEEMQALKDMLAELNQMIEAREQGEPYDFDGFMQRHGRFFPGNPQTLEQLLEQMAQRMAAMSRLLASMSPEQRAELRGLMEQMLQDMDLAFEADRLAQNLEGMFPSMPWDQQVMGDGDEAMPMSAAIDALERMHDYEDLDRSMKGDYAGAALEDVDEDALRRTLGQDAVRDLQRLKQIERALEQAGLVSRKDGRLEVTPRGARKLGERALVKLFEHLRKDREAMHEARDAGGQAEPTGATRQWRFGDTGQIAVQRSVFNAVVRGGPGRAPMLTPDDFELVEAETRTETATALLLDLSFSMPLRGHFVPAKRMALALHALIEGRYPHDTLYLIGFSDLARRMRPEDLTATGWERVYGTNMHHAFNLAGRLLANHPRATRQVIMVTDGEPTAHLLRNGQAFFNWPPEPETIRLTLQEAMRLARSGVTLNVFMLEDSPGLARFMERLARLTAGRVFLMNGEALGDFIVRDYVARRAS